MMNFAQALAIIPAMAALARLSGWGFDNAKRFASFPGEVFFALPFAVYASRQCDGSMGVLLVAEVWAYLAFQLGHGNAYHDGTNQFSFPDRRQGLDVIVRPLCRAIMWLGDRLGQAWDLSPRSTWYCRLFMGIKGLLIGVPLLGPGTLLLAITWPLSYAIGFRLFNRNSMPAEWFSGGFAGAIIAASLYFKAPSLYPLLADAAWPWVETLAAFFHSNPVPL